MGLSILTGQYKQGYNYDEKIYYVQIKVFLPQKVQRMKLKVNCETL